MNKKAVRIIISATLTYSVFIAVSYMAFSFACIGFNPKHWDLEARVCLAAIAIIALVFAIAMSAVNIADIDDTEKD